MKISRKLFLELDTIQPTFVEKIKSHIFLFINSFFFSKIHILWDNVGKYVKARQPTDDILQRSKDEIFHEV
jgi:hypothetical protein